MVQICDIFSTGKPFMKKCITSNKNNPENKQYLKIDCKIIPMQPDCKNCYRDNKYYKGTEKYYKKSLFSFY